MHNGLSAYHDRDTGSSDEQISVVLSLSEQKQGLRLELHREQAMKSRTKSKEEMTLSGLHSDQALEIVKLLDNWLGSKSYPTIDVELSDIDGIHSREKANLSRGSPVSDKTEFSDITISVSKRDIEFSYWQEQSEEWRSISIPSAELLQNDVPQDTENVVKFRETLYDFFTVEYSTQLSYFEKESSSSENSAVHKIEKIFNRFGEISLPLRERRSDREPLIMDDEADVQYLLHALLKIDFDDIRREPHTDRHSSVSPRIDFLVQNETIGIEIKRASPTRQEKPLRKELSEDKEQYRLDTNIDVLLIFIYDPEKQIENKAEFESSFEQETPQMETRVTVTR